VSDQVRDITPKRHASNWIGILLGIVGIVGAYRIHQLGHTKLAAACLVGLIGVGIAVVVLGRRSRAA
jgi:hypothetical protein